MDLVRRALYRFSVVQDNNTKRLMTPLVEGFGSLKELYGAVAYSLDRSKWPVKNGFIEISNDISHEGNSGVKRLDDLVNSIEKTSEELYNYYYDFNETEIGDLMYDVSYMKELERMLEEMYGHSVQSTDGTLGTRTVAKGNGVLVSFYNAEKLEEWSLDCYEEVSNYYEFAFGILTNKHS